MSRPSEAFFGPAIHRGKSRVPVSRVVERGIDPSVVLRFALPESCPACVSVTTEDGRLVRVLRQGVLAAGEHLCAWDGRDDLGQRVPAGDYTLQLETAGRTITSRVVQLA